MSDLGQLSQLAALIETKRTIFHRPPTFQSPITISISQNFPRFPVFKNAFLCETAHLATIGGLSDARPVMLKQTLHTGWTVKAVNDVSQVPPPLVGVAIQATVPGCIHTDLFREGKIPDPYEDFNEFQTRWIGVTDWQYTTTFNADEKLFTHERLDLVCDGLDTVATIELNGTQIAQTQNMHRSYRFDVRPSLRRGKNELKVTFTSPVKFAEANDRQNPRPYVNGPGGPFNAIRKMACNFGWDWGPALPTCGIWRGIRLEAWSHCKD